MRSWLSAAGGIGSTSLLDADQVAGGITEGAIADTVRLLGRRCCSIAGPLATCEIVPTLRRDCLS
jgi:hypothetical protein